MHRRRYLAGAVAAGGAALLSGCSGSDSGGNSTATPTPDPSPIESVTPSGLELIVKLTGDPPVKTLSLRNSEGDVVERERLPQADLKASLALANASSTASDTIDSIHPPGDYELIAITRGNEQFTQSLSLEPKVNITAMAFPTQLDSLPNGLSGDDMAAFGALAIEIENSGTLPTWLTESRLTGDRVPNPRPAPDDRSESELPDLDTPDGAGLNPFSDYDSATYNPPDIESLGVGRGLFVTEYLPGVIPESKYDVSSFGDASKAVEKDYLDKPIEGAFTLVYGHGSMENSDQTVNFNFRLTGDVRRFLRPTGNVYAFTDPRVF